MKRLISVIGLSALISCTENKIDSEIEINEELAEDTWGQLIEASPETFFAADLSDDVRTGLTSTLLTATAAWGNYGPLEYWVLGTDLEAAKDLSEQFCQRRAERGEFELSECLTENMDASKSYRFEYYRQVGVKAIANQEPSTSMGRNGKRDWGIHLFVSSYPLGFAKRLDRTPAGSQKTVFHEYFHAVQHAHIQSTDQKERRAILGPVWSNEGAAEYMAQTTVRRLWASGDLAIIDNTDFDSFEEIFKRKITKGKQTIDEHCPGLQINELTYDNECTGAAYDLGSWAIAYLLNKVGQAALLDTFYPSLNDHGWEGAFKKTYGMSSDEFANEFSLFLQKPLADQVDILPKFE